jgi:hypothetical protein
MTPAQFFRAALNFNGDECVLWPFCCDSNSYPKMTVDRKSLRVPRVICEMVYGDPPTPQHEAAHSCGIRPCINPNHLRWATKTENMADTLVHGTRIRGEQQWQAKLTEANVREIRSLKGKLTHDKIAKRFGMSIGAINCVIYGSTWGWLQ